MNLTFNTPQTAKAFFDFIIHISPFITTEFPNINSNKVQLTDEQYYFTFRIANLKTGKLPTKLLDGCFLKTLRADEFDFSYSFILGLIPEENDLRRLQNLRPTARRPFTITAEGNAVSRIEKGPRHSTEEKKGFTQIQSCTLIDKEALSPAFGFTKGRQSKLYGLVTHLDDIRLNRLLIADGGTVNRPFDFPIFQNAEHHSSLLKNRKEPLHYSPEELGHFKTRILHTSRKGEKPTRCLRDYDLTLTEAPLASAQTP